MIMVKKVICPMCDEGCISEGYDIENAGRKFTAFVCKHAKRLIYLDQRILGMDAPVVQFFYTWIIDDLLQRRFNKAAIPHYCLGPVTEEKWVHDIYIDLTTIPPWRFSHLEKIDRSLINICRLFGEATFDLDSAIAMRCMLSMNRDEAVAMENSLLDFGYITMVPFPRGSEKYIVSKEGWLRIDEIFRKESDMTGFVAMKFGDETLDTRESIKNAIEKCGFEPIVIDEIEHNNQIVPEIRSRIRRCRFLVMDCSVPNLGAYYEAGMAVGAGKEAIICCNEESFHNDDTKPHFDVAQQSMVLWKDCEDLENKLTKRILATIEGASPVERKN